MHCYIVIICCVLAKINYVKGQDTFYGSYDYNNYNQYSQITSEHTTDGSSFNSNSIVSIDVYYEALCPSCKQFDTTTLKETVQELGSHLNIHLVPYGNAKTVDNGYGGYDFVSQHGPEETYGNKLHACAVDLIQNQTTAVLFNSCMMEQAGQGSDDAAADTCGRYNNVNSEAIKQCAQSDRGSQLLKQHGDESKAVGFKSVPTILINGVPSSTEHFKEDIYKALGRPLS